MFTRFNGIQPKFAAVVNPKREIHTPTHGAPIVIPLDVNDKESEELRKQLPEDASKESKKPEKPSLENSKGSEGESKEFKEPPPPPKEPKDSIELITIN